MLRYEGDNVPTLSIDDVDTLSPIPKLSVYPSQNSKIFLVFVQEFLHFWEEHTLDLGIG